MSKDKETIDNGSVLSDSEIARHLEDGTIIITPLIDVEHQLGPASIDLSLGTDFIISEPSEHTHFDPARPFEHDPGWPDFSNQHRDYYEEKRYKKQQNQAVRKRIRDPRQPFVLHPREFILGSTLEFVTLPDNIVGTLDGRSSWSRVGLQVHSTASIVQPGTSSVITFELQNVGLLPIKLYVGSRVAQLQFKYLDQATSKPYNLAEKQRPTEPKYACHYRTQAGEPWRDVEFKFWPR